MQIPGRSAVIDRGATEGDPQREQDQRVLLKGIGAAASITVGPGTKPSQLVSVAFALRNPVTTTVPFGGFENSGSPPARSPSGSERRVADQPFGWNWPRFLADRSAVGQFQAEIQLFVGDVTGPSPAGVLGFYPGAC